MMNATITIDEVMKKDPDLEYDKVKHVFHGRDFMTAQDIANSNRMSRDFKINILIQCFMITKTQRLFAAWCAESALKTVKSPDPQFVAAVIVAKQYSNEEVTIKKLNAAWETVYKLIPKTPSEPAGATVLGAVQENTVWAAWSAYTNANRTYEYAAKEVKEINSVYWDGIQIYQEVVQADPLLKAIDMIKEQSSC